MDPLRAQVLALQQEARCQEGNKDGQEISPYEGDSRIGENTLGHPWLHQER